MGFNYSLCFQKCQTRRILFLAKTIFDLLLNAFCKRDPYANLEQQVELYCILPLHYSCLLAVVDDLSNTKMRDLELSSLRNWVMISTEKAVVIVGELWQIQWEDERSWGSGYPITTGHLCWGCRHRSAAVKARRPCEYHGF